MNNKSILLALVILVFAGGIGLFYHFRNRKESSGPRYRVRTEFEFTVQAPYKITAPLFGPEGERAWASDDWNPRFVYPEPAQDVEGAVFQVSHGHHTSTWVNTAFDLERGHIEYVYFLPDLMTTRIDIHLTQTNSDTTGVHVAYERTALSAAANQRVREFGEHDRNNGAVWGADIERHLASQRR